MKPAVRALGGYDILAELKSGGMGEVLLARKRGAGGFERLVALKTIRQELKGNLALREMFLDEARLLSRLTHPAIAHVYDVGEDGDSLWLAMEYVAGVRFRRLAELRPPPAVAARAMAEVLRGLHAAHELHDPRGGPLLVVHRDVSPENLMLTFDGKVKVLDFGIALMRGRQAPVTEYGTIKGKPPYLSPEQVKNQPVDRRSDLFSAAAVLHEILTGAPLFEGDSVYAVARAIEHQPLAPPSERAGPLPAGLDEAVMYGLARDPAERWQNALAFAEALDRIAAADGGESLQAFARAHLGPEQEAHELQLRALLEGGHEGGKGGRPSGIMTAQAAERSGLRTPRAEEFVPVPEPEPSPRRLGVGPLFGLVAVGLLAFGAVVLVGLWRRDGEAVPPDATAPIAIVREVAPADAAVASAAVPASAPAPDAAPAHIARDRPKRPRSVPVTVPDPLPPDPAPALPAGEGFLSIGAEPYALVRIDGQEVGSTPIIRRTIAAGDHEIVLISPDSGAVRLTRRVSIRPGKHENIVLR